MADQDGKRIFLSIKVESVNNIVIYGGELMTVLHYGAIYILGSWVVLGFLIFKTDMFKID